MCFQHVAVAEIQGAVRPVTGDAVGEQVVAQQVAPVVSQAHAAGFQRCPVFRHGIHCILFLQHGSQIADFQLRCRIPGHPLRQSQPQEVLIIHLGPGAVRAHGAQKMGQIHLQPLYACKEKQRRTLLVDGIRQVPCMGVGFAAKRLQCRPIRLLHAPEILRQQTQLLLGCFHNVAAQKSLFDLVLIIHDAILS